MSDAHIRDLLLDVNPASRERFIVIAKGLLDYDPKWSGEEVDHESDTEPQSESAKPKN